MPCPVPGSDSGEAPKDSHGQSGDPSVQYQRGEQPIAACFWVLLRCFLLHIWSFQKYKNCQEIIKTCLFHIVSIGSLFFLFQKWWTLLPVEPFKYQRVVAEGLSWNILECSLMLSCFLHFLPSHLYHLPFPSRFLTPKRRASVQRMRS